MRTLLAISLALALGNVRAQAMATPRNPDPALIFDLLGTVNAVEVDLPVEVRHVFVFAVHEGEVVLEAERETTSDTVAAAITAGALAEVARCPLLLFAELELLGEGGRPYAGNRGTRCLPLEEVDRVRGGVRAPLGAFRDAMDLPVDRWLAVETLGFGASDPAAEPDAIGSDVVFYLHLSTSRAEVPPGTPGYETWSEVRGAFR